MTNYPYKALGLVPNGPVWIYGEVEVVDENLGKAQIEYLGNTYPVDLSSLCSRTPHQDSNGNVIYEGDILRTGNFAYVVVFDPNDKSYKRKTFARIDARNRWQPVTKEIKMLPMQTMFPVFIIGNVCQPFF